MTTLETHLKSRDFDLARHRVWLDHEANRATFPLWNLHGQLKGYQQYQPHILDKKTNDPRDSRYYSYMTEPAWWGFESWNYTPGLLFVTEGIFDACRLTARGYSAIATLTCDPGKTFRNFVFTCGRRVVVVADNDENGSGRRLTKYGHQHVFCESGDLGDSDPVWIEQMLNKFS